MNLLQNLKDKIQTLFKKEESSTEKQSLNAGEFLQLVGEFESKIKEEFQFELQQVYYAPAMFGSGKVTYKVKGRIVELGFDGRENAIGNPPIEVRYSKPHSKYGENNWAEAKMYTVSEFWSSGVYEILEKLKYRK